MLGALLAADEAERRGDARAALKVMEAHPESGDGSAFWRLERIQRLLQVMIFGPALPGWAVSRWLVEQARQYLHPQMRVRHRRAMQVVTELRGGEARLPGVDLVDARAKVMDYDWVFRQLTLYEYGGLDLFLRCGASPDLVSGADGIRAWPQAPMRSLRFEDSQPDVLALRDLGSGEAIRVPNLGAGVLLVPGECALGRLVPVASGLMFDGPPLRVSDAAAVLAADDPVGWLEAVRHDAGSKVFQPSLLHGNLLLTDVPDRIAAVAVAPHFAPARTTEATIEDVADAVLSLAREAVWAEPAELDGEFDGEFDGGLDVWPCLAAELVAPSTRMALADRAGRRDVPVLEALADLLPEPAAEVCRELLRGLDAAA